MPPPPAAAAAPARIGTLSVKAVPYALVFANGKPLGEVTGGRTFKLPARTYELEFVKNKTRKTVTVTVVANEVTEVEFDGQ
jgi:serine/threonine-protein kinase